MNEEQKNTALRLAGRLAIAANRVVNSNTKALSGNILELENALLEYDNYIFSISEEKQKWKSG